MTESRVAVRADLIAGAKNAEVDLDREGYYYVALDPALVAYSRIFVLAAVVADVEVHGASLPTVAVRHPLTLGNLACEGEEFAPRVEYWDCNPVPKNTGSWAEETAAGPLLDGFAAGAALVRKNDWLRTALDRMWPRNGEAALGIADAPAAAAPVGCDSAPAVGTRATVIRPSTMPLVVWCRAGDDHRMPTDSRGRRRRLHARLAFAKTQAPTQLLLLL